MSDSNYFDLIEATFESVEMRLEALPEDPDLAVAEGVINARFPNGVVFVFSRQPPTEQLWLATPGGGFHYVWDAAAGDWRDTKTSDLFRAFLPRQLKQHADVDFSWE